MLSLYFWLRAIGGDPAVPLAQHPLLPIEDHVVRVLGPAHRDRPHVTKSRRPDNAAAGTLRLEAVRAVVTRPARSAVASPRHSGGGSSTHPAPPSTTPPPAASPPPPPPPPAPPRAPPPAAPTPATRSGAPQPPPPRPAPQANGPAPPP